MIYQYKATLPNQRTFLRVYEAKAVTTLYALHVFLQNDLSFSPDQQVLFRTVDDAGNLLHEYGLFDMGDGSMDQIRLESLYRGGVRAIRYVFDLFNGRYLLLQWKGAEEELPRKVYPRTVTAQGGDPEQFREERASMELNFEELESVNIDGGEE